MLKRKALRKILITTFTVFTLFVLYLIPTKLNDDYINANIDVIYTSNTTNHEIYLIGENNYLVKFQIFLNSEDMLTNVKTIINYLKVDTAEKIPTGLRGIIPKDVNVLDISQDGKRLTVNFSNKLLETEEKLEERMIEAIVYSLTSLIDVDEVVIKVEGVELKELPKAKKQLDMPLTREFGINKVYNITGRNGIQKVTLYYQMKISNNNYYVPVTKYLNDDREKIKIIIDNLASSYIYEENLMSYLNSKTTILDYEENDEEFILNLNDAVFGNSAILEEVEYTLGYSILENYDVDKVLLKVNGKVVSEVSK